MNHSEPVARAVASADGAHAELLVVRPLASPRAALLWLPALGVPARHYLPLAQALAAHGIAVGLHEWRGLGSSDRRAGRRVDWGYRELLIEDLPASLAVLREAVPGVGIHFGGHSLGGQMACLLAALRPDDCRGLALVASGAPYWRQYPHGWLVRLAYQLAPVLANVVGYLPGRRIGFGGNEARRLIDDWARSGRSGRYAAAGLPVDLERALGLLRCRLLGVRLVDDWLVPAASLQWLIDKMPAAPRECQELTRADLDGETADHFHWMKHPEKVAAVVGGWLFS